jgi:hypothetical protein
VQILTQKEAQRRVAAPGLLTYVAQDVLELEQKLAQVASGKVNQHTHSPAALRRPQLLFTRSLTLRLSDSFSLSISRSRSRSLSLSSSLSVSLSVYIYVYICMYVCMYACMLACMHVWMYVCTRICGAQTAYIYKYV